VPFASVSDGTFAQDEGTTTVLTGGGNASFAFLAPRTVTFTLPNNDIYRILFKTQGAVCTFAVTAFQ
jgi:hypothetical protein